MTKPTLHQLHLTVNANGFNIRESLVIFGQVEWNRERILANRKLFDEAQQLLTNLSSLSTDGYNKWLETHGFIPWDKDEIVKTFQHELPINLQTITLGLDLGEIPLKRDMHEATK
jgi:hypothetical protein